MSATYYRAALTMLDRANSTIAGAKLSAGGRFTDLMRLARLQIAAAQRLQRWAERADQREAA